MAANQKSNDQDLCHTAREVELLYSVTNLQFNQDYCNQNPIEA